MAIPVIINPTSGKGKAASLVDEISNCLKAAGIDPDISVTAGPGDVRKLTEQAIQGSDTIIAVGGDGTINEVINGLQGAPVKLGIIPFGTGNVLAREIGLPLNDISNACIIIAKGHTRVIDLAQVNGKYFILMAGFGFDAEVIKRVNPWLKDRIGTKSYWPAIISSLVRFKTAQFTLQLDENTWTFDSPLIVVANSTRYATDIELAPEAIMDDGFLDVVIFKNVRPLRLNFIRQAINVLKDKQNTDQSILHLRARQISIDADPAMLMQIDGDVDGTTPAVIEVVPKGLELIVPE